MKMSSYLLLMFSMSLVLYLLGYTSVFNLALDNQHAEVGNDNGFIQQKDVLTRLADLMLSGSGLTILIGGVIAGLVGTLLGGHGAPYVIKLVMLLAFVNLFVFPLSFIFDPSTPTLLSQPVLYFFNLITVLSVVEFVKEGST